MDRLQQKPYEMPGAENEHKQIVQHEPINQQKKPVSFNPLELFRRLRIKNGDNGQHQPSKLNKKVNKPESTQKLQEAFDARWAERNRQDLARRRLDYSYDTPPHRSSSDVSSD